MSRKIIYGALVGLVFLITILSLLAVWEVISLEYLFQKAFTSLAIIFIASVLILFINSIIPGSKNKKSEF